jgi:primosomal protein N' (replication factor Y)
MTTDPIKVYLEVAVVAPVDRPLTYLPPEDWKQQLLPGMRVLVPLAGRKVTGYILSRTDSTPFGQQLKKIYEPLDTEPLFPAEQVEFYKWIARYYHYPIGEVIKTALPAGLTQKSGRRILLTETGAKHLSQINETGIKDAQWFSDLLAKGEISPHVTRTLWVSKERKLFEEWAEEDWVIISSEIVGGTAKPKTEICCALSGSVDSLDGLLVSEKKTVGALQKISAAAKHRFVPRKDIIREYPGAGKGLRSLEQKGLVVFGEQQVYRDPFGESFLESYVPETLTNGQKKVLDSILPAIKKGSFSPFLLHGVTGSGKTEVYLQAAAYALERGKTVLVLVPEIALASQLEAHFLARFGSRVALLHSGLSSGQRYDQWCRILQGKADVVIGARSAVFAPLKHPGLIIVDEEHDSSYKQDDGFRYHARDLAILRASQSNGVVILGSATPSVTSYFHARNGKYHLLALDKRIEDRPLPAVKIVDMHSVKTLSGKMPVFSPLLIENLTENFVRHEQSLVFLNRRGYANFMICRECGHTVQCRNCHISLTLHKADNILLCHYCGFTAAGKTICSNCQSTSLTAIGIGTERLEQELSEMLPEAKIARLDRDTCQKRKDLIRILKAVHSGDIDILLGTQMITKGHHFPNVTLVGIVLADTGLGLPDFRAGERTFQLISQVTGRAGRGEKPGRVIIQTFQPEHHSIEMARKHDFAGMYAREIDMRKHLGYPPFSRLINLKIEGKDESNVQETAGRLADLARKIQKKSSPEVLGPAPAPLTRLRDRYRWQILLKGERLETLHEFVYRLEGGVSGLSKGDRLKISVDVDHEYMM